MKKIFFALSLVLPLLVTTSVSAQDATAAPVVESGVVAPGMTNTLNPGCACDATSADINSANRPQYNSALPDDATTIAPPPPAPAKSTR